MFKQGLIEQEITRRYYRHYSNLNVTNDGYSGTVLTLNYPYQHILGRSPSSGELAPFFKAIKNGTSKKKIMSSILFSKESLLRNTNPPRGIYFSMLDLLTVRKVNFVSQLFLQVLNRLPRENELTVWRKRQRFLTKLGALILFLRVTEYKINFKVPAFSSFTFSISFKVRRLYKLTWFDIKDILRGLLSKGKSILRPNTGSAK